MHVRMIPRLSLAACGALVLPAHAFEAPAVVYPHIVERAVTPEAFVPPGWRLEHHARGRLNQDALEDAVLVLRMARADNVVDNTGMGVARFDTNPRMLLALVAEADGRWRRVMTDTTLVPRPESPVMDDVLMDDAAAAVTIRPNRTWSVGLHSWASAGSWSTRQLTYTFRLEGGCMRLIGFDDMDLHRGSGAITTTSVNYLSGRAWRAPGSIEDATPGPRQATRLVSTARLCIGDLGDGLSFTPDLAALPTPDPRRDHAQR